MGGVKGDVSPKQDLQVLKQDLVKKKEDLEHVLENLNKEQFSDGQVQDSADQALSSTMDSFNNSLQNTKIAEYKRIVRAIEMIDDGTYGLCIDCDKNISEKRLSLFPNATRCLLCQEEFEELGL